MTEQRERESTRIRELRERQAEKDRIRALQHNQHPELDNRYLQSHTAPQFNTNPALQEHQEKEHRNPHITNKSNWNKKQRIRYLVFLKFYSEITFFGSDLKSIPTFKTMSQFVKTRSPQQSKSFHLSNKRLFNSQQELIQALTDDLQHQQNFEKLLDRYENQIVQFDQQCNFLSDNYLQMNSYFRKKLNMEEKSDNEEEQVQKKNKSYNSRINITDLMKEKSNSELQEKQRFNTDSKISKGSLLKQQQASSQQAHLNSYNSHERFAERYKQPYRNKYQIPNPYKISPQQMNYFNPYPQEMNKIRMDPMSQMNRFQIQQDIRTKQILQQQEYQKRLQNLQEQRKITNQKIKNISGISQNNPYLNLNNPFHQEQKKANYQKMKNQNNISSNNPYVVQPGLNTPYFPYLDNRYAQNRGSNINMPSSIPQYMPGYSSNIPNMPSNFFPNNINYNSNLALSQASKYNNMGKTQHISISPQKLNMNNFSREIRTSENLVKQNQNPNLNTQGVVMSDQRKRLIETCHQHWTKWLKGVLQLKARRQKQQQRNQIQDKAQIQDNE